LWATQLAHRGEVVEEFATLNTEVRDERLLPVIHHQSSIGGVLAFQATDKVFWPFPVSVEDDGTTAMTAGRGWLPGLMQDPLRTFGAG
jgi:hypothetical protein